MPDPLAHPEIQPLIRDLFRSLIGESDRGAVLIGASHVDEHLEQLFRAAFPAEMSNTRRKSVIDYPGPLNSFSTKIEIAYSLRLIKESLYKALHALRRLRNDVAHGTETFSLLDHRERIERAFDLGNEIPGAIRECAAELLVGYKVHLVRRFVEDEGEEFADIADELETDQQIVDLIRDRPELMEHFRSELPRWELVIGIALTCALIVYSKEDLIAVFGEAGTIRDVAKSVSDRNNELGATH